MKIRMQTSHDQRSINKWLRARGLNLISEQSVYSFIIPGVCAGQFLQCEQDTLLFDSLVSNPLVSGPTRDKALNQLIEHMTKLCLGKRILALSVDSGTIRRAEALGYKKQPHVVLTYKG